MTNTRRLLVVTAGLLGSVALTVGGGVAVAGPAEPAPTGGPGSHPHHVHQGDGTCEDIDEQEFERDHRALHRAATNTDEPGQGPDHGTCQDHVNGH